MSSGNGINNVESPQNNLHGEVSEALGALSRSQEAAARPEPELLDLLLVVAQRKWPIFRATVAGGLLALGIALLLPNTYTATAIVMPPQQNQGSASALLGQLGGLAAMAGASSLGLKSPSDLYVGLLSTRTISDAIIDRFKLLEVYEVKTRIDAADKLASRRRFSAGKDSLIHIDVDDKDPKRAADMANRYAIELNLKNTAIAANEAAQKRAFLEKRLNEEKTALAAAEETMKNQQQQSGIMQVENQARITVTAIAQLRAEIAAQEVMLQRMRMGATAQNPEVIGAEAELSGLRAQLKKLENSSAAQTLGDPFMPMSRLPAAGLDYLRKLRDLKFHEFLFEMLTKQYEAARLDESKQTPALPIVDYAVPPDKKSGPRRSVIVIAGFLVSALLSSAIVCLMHITQRSEENDKLKQLKLALWPGRGR